MEQEFTEFSEFRESDKSLKHELESILSLTTFVLLALWSLTQEVVTSWSLTQEVAGWQV